MITGFGRGSSDTVEVGGPCPLSSYISLSQTPDTQKPSIAVLLRIVLLLAYGREK